MATINGYTAERMKEIEDNTIVDATVVGDDLVLSRYDGSTKNAGNVRGAQGLPGDQEVDSKIAAALNLADPPGTAKPYTGSVIPDGHGICDAETQYSSGTYPKLAALYGTGASCINGASVTGTFRLPNLKGKVLVGRDASIAAFDTLHEVGGSKDAVVVSHNHTASADQAAHSHSSWQNAHSHSSWQNAHSHGGGVVPEGSHVHGVDNGDTGYRIAVTVPSGTHYTVNDGSANKAQALSYTAMNLAGYHGHAIPSETPGIGVSSETPAIGVSVEDPAVWVTVNAQGISGVDKNLPPYRVINWIMRLV